MTPARGLRPLAKPCTTVKLPFFVNPNTAPSLLAPPEQVASYSAPFALVKLARGTVSGIVCNCDHWFAIVGRRAIILVISGMRFVREAPDLGDARLAC
jgi:hypothetical protein